MNKKLNRCYLITVSLSLLIVLATACHEQAKTVDTQIDFGVEITQQASPLPAGTEESEHAQITPNPNVILKMVGEVNQERVLTDLRRLTGAEPICTSYGCYTITNRETGGEGLQWAKDYIYEQLVSMDYVVEIQDWSRSGYTDQNLIARKYGSVYPGEEIVFIAHVDGYLENNPAADDDASGVVCLLEVARILSSRSLSRTVVLIFSTGEEHGSLGSHSYVDQLTPEQVSAIKYLVSVEMIGYDSNHDGAMELWSGDQPQDFVQLLSELITAYVPGLTPKIITGCT